MLFAASLVVQFHFVQLWIRNSPKLQKTLT